MLQRIALAALICTGTATDAETIYKCGNAYSDEPCKGATVVDVLPTEGAHSLSGKKRMSNEAINRSGQRALDDLREKVIGIPAEESARRREERRHKSIPRIKVEP
ncbi:MULTISPECIES: hypothetical protein [Delftia]|uniref:hypothetical protein n=1 Tax=Delftia TaxID=80865 RepID=UPI0008E18F3C|nr:MULTISPECIES: hypothetical protein [Delftia]MPT53559.1 hypothetical protein [Delftia sp.]SFB48990.1 hypothetical protein SAMN05444579_1072 [Delftia tsuruhatensis]